MKLVLGQTAGLPRRPAEPALNMRAPLPPTRGRSTAYVLAGSLGGLLCAVVVAACSEGTGPRPAATWTSLTAGLHHTCGVTSGGAASCWGFNGGGQLDDGLASYRPTPVAVANP